MRSPGTTPNCVETNCAKPKQTDVLATAIDTLVPSAHRAGFDAVAGCVFGFNVRRIGG
jgi:hypothetical protein